MIRQAFSCPDIDRVVASTMAANTGSRRVLEKLGDDAVRRVGGVSEQATGSWLAARRGGLRAPACQVVAFHIEQEQSVSRPSPCARYGRGRVGEGSNPDVSSA